jgi:post-segregation antitoxin (ccd killing protein)
MRDPGFDYKAGKQTVSLTLNSDLYAKVKSVGINASKVAEKALAEAYVEHQREAVAAGIRQDLAAIEEYAAQHGSFPDLVRQHNESEDDAV